MDADLIPISPRKGKELVVFPDADVSEPGTESESEGDAIERASSLSEDDEIQENLN